MTRHRAIFVSDVHLGLKYCQADRLLAFLRANTADAIYLVGDILDIWELGRSWLWTQEYNDLFELLFTRVREGVRVVYVIGNHDEDLRAYRSLLIAGVELADEAVHLTGDGRRALVIHGHQFDMALRYGRWLTHLGGHAYYTAALVLNRAARVFGIKDWSMSTYLKQHVTRVAEFMRAYTDLAVAAAEAHRCEIIVTGHVHHAEIRKIQGVSYMNAGDWVESCTAIVEALDGKFEIVHV